MPYSSLEPLDFGLVSGFELRISDLPGSARPIGFAFAATLVFGPGTLGIGFVWRIEGQRSRASGDSHCPAPNHQ
jgi:hypothetical protein